MRFLIVFLSVTLALAFFPTGDAPARSTERPICTCTPADFKGRVQGADKIFTGTVVSIDIPQEMIQAGRDDPPATVTLIVDEPFKSSTTRTREILHTSLTRVTCTGHDFKEGESYLIFAYERKAATYEDWSLYTYKTGTFGVGGLCGGTAPLQDARAVADMAELKRLKAANDPVLTPPLEPETP